MVLATGLLVGCGPAPGPYAPEHAGVAGRAAPAAIASPFVDPCTLLTRAEVAAVLKEPVGAPLSEQEMVDAECNYSGAADNSGSTVAVELAADGTAQSSFERRKHFFLVQGATPVGGFGAEAYAKGGAVLVRHKRVIFYLVLLHETWDAPARFAAAKVLALKALSRLP